MFSGQKQRNNKHWNGDSLPKNQQCILNMSGENNVSDGHADGNTDR